MSGQTVKFSSRLDRPLRGSLTPPPDKSITHRALFFTALSRQKSVIRNPLSTGDCLSTLKAFRKLGLAIKTKGKVWTSKGGRLRAPASPIDCENSGTTMRLLSGLLAAQNFNAVLTGDASLSKRPMRRVLEPLRKMGAELSAKGDNFAPIRIQGRPDLRGITWKLPVASAQVKSAILLAGLFAKGRTTVIEPTRSRDHTERLLKSLGAKIKFKTAGTLNVPNRVTIQGETDLRGLHLTVPGDFSSAAFFIAAALIVPGSHLRILGVNLNPTRAGLLKTLKAMGAKIKIHEVQSRGAEPSGNIDVWHSELRSVRVSAAQIPSMIDEIPILAVIATQAHGRTAIGGAEELRIKESDRIATMASQLKKMGADISEKKDGLIIRGRTFLKGTRVQSFHDHRVAMSMAVAALAAQGTTEIADFDCTKVSYPDFLSDLKKISS